MLKQAAALYHALYAAFPYRKWKAAENWGSKTSAKSGLEAHCPLSDLAQKLPVFTILKW